MNCFGPFRDEELVTEVAWVVVYLSALSEKATSLIVRSSMPQLLIGRLLASENLQLLIPVSYLFLDRIFSLCLFLVSDFFLKRNRLLGHFLLLTVAQLTILYSKLISVCHDIFV
jgi:hypothetical protein